MKSSPLIKSIPFIVICFFAYFFIGMLIAYHDIFKSQESDLLGHLAVISKIGSLNFPQMGFEYTVFSLAKLTQLNLKMTALLFFSSALAFQAALTYFILHQLSPLKNITCLLFTLIAMACFAIYIPLHQLPSTLLISKNGFINSIINFFKNNIFGGIGSPNEWGSPTLMVVKPLGLLMTYWYISQDNLKNTLRIAILLMISCFYKPSFATIFVPAILLYELLIKHQYNKNFLIKIILIIFPSVLILSVMFYIMSFVYHTPNGQTTRVIIDPLGVIHFYVKNVPGAILQALFFPLLIAIIRAKQIIKQNAFLVFSWLMLLFGYLYWALLAQSGSLYADGNFKWGYELGLSYVFIFSIVEYMRWVFSFSPNTVLYNRYLFVLVSIALLLHVLAGIGALSAILLVNSPLKWLLIK